MLYGEKSVHGITHLVHLTSLLGHVITLTLSIGMSNNLTAVIRFTVFVGIWQVNSGSPISLVLILVRHRCRKVLELRMWNRFYC